MTFKCVHNTNTLHGAMLCYLLQIKLRLNFLKVTGVIKDRLGKLVLYVGQPGTKAVHIFIQLLYSHQSFSELLHSMKRSHERVKLLWLNI